MTAGRYIDYEALAQEAMRGIIRAVLSQIAKSGLFGDHHFFIAFNTQAPGVALSKRLREKYPAEMTIVLQHRFWDLEVGDDRFEVKLTFDGIPERLSIPFKAVKVFYDPSVPYGLQFEEAEFGADVTRRAGGPPREVVQGGADAGALPGGGDGERGERRSDKVRRPRGDRAEARPEGKPEKERPTLAPVPAAPIAAVPAPAAAGARSDEAQPAAAADKPAAEKQPPRPAARPVLAEVKADETAPDGDKGEPKPDAKVVDLSKFRKK